MGLYLGSKKIKNSTYVVTPTDDATAAITDIKQGKTAYVRGQKITGTFTTSDATAAASDIKQGKTAYVNDQKITGTFTTSGTATAAEIVSGKTAWVNDAQLTGTLVYNVCYVSSSEPTSSQGNVGDLWLVTS